MRKQIQQIKQIIPAAPDWFALFADDAGGAHRVPLACWALVQHRTEDDYGQVIPSSVSEEIVPMDSDSAGLLNDPRTCENFIALVNPIQSGPRVQEMIRAYYAEKKAAKVTSTQP